MQEEETARAAEEAEKTKAEEAEKRRQERLERRADMKKKGLLLTGKQKAEAQRLAAVREQLLAQAGLDPSGMAACSSSIQSATRYVHRSSQWSLTGKTGRQWHASGC